MVRRQLSARARFTATLLALGAVTAGVVPAADAANRRVAISDYQWTLPVVEVDLGEHVTWHWVGPDTMHSVTGDSPNARGYDSDPGNHQPIHQLGDSYQASFDTPGVYDFTCKLHSSVRGTVVVSSNPGDPTTEIDPVPANRTDIRAPEVRNLSLAAKTVSHRGTRLSFALDERAQLDAEFFRREGNGKRDYSGFETWRGLHIGLNDVRFGSPGKRFKGEPGRYLVKLTASDSLGNTSRVRKLRFEIKRRG